METNSQTSNLVRRHDYMIDLSNGKRWYEIHCLDCSSIISAITNKRIRQKVTAHGVVSDYRNPKRWTLMCLDVQNVLSFAQF